MQTIRLRVNDKIYKHLMWFLRRFNNKEIEIIRENGEYVSVQDYLVAELNKMED